MPDRETFARLQQTLVERGHLAQSEVREVADPHEISAALQNAIGAAHSHLRHRPLDDRAFAENPSASLGDLLAGLSATFCSVPDAGSATSPLHIQTFGAPGGRWSRGALKFSVNAAGSSFTVPLGAPPTSPAAMIAAAFAQWQAVLPFFTFTQVGVNSGEDIRVVFGNASVDPAFGAAGGVLASAGYPEKGNVQFDSAEAWTPATLLSVALHEIGHSLGLSHSDNPASLMYPYSPPIATIDAESRLALMAIYGWQPQQGLGDRATTDRASLGITSSSNFTSRFETPHMVWKGSRGDTGIYTSELGANGWSPQARIPGIGSAQSPSLTQIGAPGPTPATGLFMAWRGVPDDDGLYWSRNLGAGFEPQHPIPGTGSSHRPSVANLNGTVIMAWKGIPGDSGIYWSTFDGAQNWSGQSSVRGVGTSESPALVAYNNRLYMFWKGIEGDSNAYWSFIDFANGSIWQPQRRIEFFSFETGGGVPIAIGTSSGLSATVRGNVIVLAWKGAGDDTGIWFSFFDGTEFSGQTLFPNAGTSTGPSVVQAGGKTYMAWRGIGDDSNIWWSQL